MIRIIQLTLLWLGAVLFALFALAQGNLHPWSPAVIFFLAAGLLLTPPFRAYVSRYFSLSAGRTAAAVLLVGGVGMYIAVGENEAGARAEGWATATDRSRAKQLGLTTPAELAHHEAQERAKAKRIAEAEARKNGWRRDNARAAKLLAAKRAVSPQRSLAARRRVVGGIDRPSFSINTKCRNKWPNDYTMEKYCVDQQHAAQNWARGQGIENGIARHCAGRWSDDWSMFKYCVTQQRKARNALGG